jgi:hypothetical protein
VSSIRTPPGDGAATTEDQKELRGPGFLSQEGAGS